MNDATAPLGHEYSNSEAGTKIHRTPCVGICSTTYGDLVCRGCKRFSHEVVGWNQFTGDQRKAVTSRLSTLLAQSVHAHLNVSDRERSVPDEDVHDLLKGLKSLDKQAFDGSVNDALATMRISLRTDQGMDFSTLSDLIHSIEKEFYLRSEAIYEYSYNTLITSDYRGNVGSARA